MKLSLLMLENRDFFVDVALNSILSISVVKCSKNWSFDLFRKIHLVLLSSELLLSTTLISALEQAQLLSISTTALHTRCVRKDYAWILSCLLKAIQNRSKFKKCSTLLALLLIYSINKRLIAKWSEKQTKSAKKRSWTNFGKFYPSKS